jgi:hypothetical protein
MAESFPLDWPLGYKKTSNRKRSAFREKTLGGVQNLLRAELNRLGARSMIVSSNLPLRKDGNIYSEYLSKKIDEPGIAVYFKYRQQDVVICCDQYEYPWENMYALAKGIEAIRSMERWGVSEFMERAFTGFKALPEKIEQAWYDVLGIDRISNAVQIKEAYRRMAQIHHPDVGGSVEMFNKINSAYQQALKSL